MGSRGTGSKRCGIMFNHEPMREYMTSHELLPVCCCAHRCRASVTLQPHIYDHSCADICVLLCHRDQSEVIPRFFQATMRTQLGEQDSSQASKQSERLGIVIAAGPAACIKCDVK